MFSKLECSFTRKQYAALEKLRQTEVHATELTRQLPTALDAFYVALLQKDPLPLGQALANLAALTQAIYEKMGLPITVTEDSSGHNHPSAENPTPLQEV